MHNKKIWFAIFSFFILVIVFSPYTIIKLTSYGQDLFSDNPEYQLLETQVADYQKEVDATLAELAKVDAEIASNNEQAQVVESEPVFDPAIAPAKVSAKILLADTGKVPDFSVRVKFIAVGEKSFETKTNKSGKIEISLASGRYYAEIIPEDNKYRLEGDAPAFFLSANSEKDFGELYLVKK
ncbi:MAG: hypothetical protein WCK16_04320 [Candidatus Moraniibacteriota bacterium]